jgi:hypothetical protein
MEKPQKNNFSQTEDAKYHREAVFPLRQTSPNNSPPEMDLTG